MDIKRTISQMTNIEKAYLVQGTNGNYTNKVDRLGIPSLFLSDGPHGVRVPVGDLAESVVKSKPATCFPPAVNMGSSFDAEAVGAVGSAIAEEAKCYDVSILLGPGINIKRNPLCGRNFEYYSEDPVVSGEIGTAYVKGVQKEKVGVSLKHFALNNQENFRFLGRSYADERTIREIYFRPFERVVKKANPATVMCAYNAINGVYSSENEWLLTDVLRKEWGYKGAVVSDWGATHDRVRGVKAGLDIEMPGDSAYCRKLVYDALNNGTITEEEIDEVTERILRVVDRYGETGKDVDSFDVEAHHDLAVRVACGTAVLMKNCGEFPLDKEDDLFIVGEFFERMRYQGSGSSMLTPTKLVNPKDAFDLRGIKYTYCQGYKSNTKDTVKELLDAALAEAKNHKKALVFMGLTDFYEGEGADREDMLLPESQLALLHGLLELGLEVSIVLFGGSPVELPFLDEIKCLLNMYMPGQGGGEAAARLIFGEVSPSGKLAETWPKHYADVPYAEEYSKTEVEKYKENIYVGYRYYGTNKKEVAFPFGHGLSYTTFEYSDLTVERKEGVVTATVTVKNTGKTDGKEVVFLFVKNNANSSVFKAEKELRAFTKVSLAAGESKRVGLSFDLSDLAYYDVCNGWTLENGEYEVQVCSSYDAVRLSEKLVVSEGVTATCPYETDIVKACKEGAMDDETFDRLIGMKVPAPRPIKPYDFDSPMGTYVHSFWGKILFKAICYFVPQKQMRAALKKPEGVERDNHVKSAFFLQRTFDRNTPIGMSMGSSGAMPFNLAEMFVDIGNGHVLRALGKLFKSYKTPKIKDKKSEKAEKERSRHST